MIFSPLKDASCLLNKSSPTPVLKPNNSVICHCRLLTLYLYQRCPFPVPGGEPVIMYQRRALGNITGSVTNNLVRPPVPGTPAGVVPGHGYPRPPPPSHPAAPPPVMAPAASHYPRPHLVGHDTNFMCKLLFLLMIMAEFCI